MSSLEYFGRINVSVSFKHYVCCIRCNQTHDDKNRRPIGIWYMVVFSSSGRDTSHVLDLFSVADLPRCPYRGPL